MPLEVTKLRQHALAMPLHALELPQHVPRMPQHAPKRASLPSSAVCLHLLDSGSLQGKPSKPLISRGKISSTDEMGGLSLRILAWRLIH